MDFNKLLKINKDFYKKTAGVFSTTRQYPWKGWGRIKKYIKKGSSILDLGCGNGRFYKYLASKEINYKGLDSNKTLLREAKLLGAKVELFDVIKHIEKIKGTYDIVVAFGLTHHIPSKKFRKKWFSYLPKLLKKGGVLVLNFWNFDTKNQKSASLEKGDYFLGWDKKKNLYRYCHKYSSEELNEIKILLEKNGCILKKTFESDGKNNKSNKYFIFKKIPAAT